jgi:hypothetical protein
VETARLGDTYRRLVDPDYVPAGQRIASPLPRQLAQQQPAILAALGESARRTLRSVPHRHSEAVFSAIRALGRSPATVDRVLSGQTPVAPLTGSERAAAQKLRNALVRALQPTPEEAAEVLRSVQEAIARRQSPAAVRIEKGRRVLTFRPADFRTFVEQSDMGGLNFPDPEFGDYLRAKGNLLIGHIQVNGIDTVFVSGAPR